MIDEIIELTVKKSKKRYPKRLRRVAIWDEENKQEIELITNQMYWTANTISELYKARWDVEIFFREIKQLLHVKSSKRNEIDMFIQFWKRLGQY